MSDATGTAVVEKARIIQPTLLVVDVFLVERPADALGHAALNLAFDITRMDRSADILRRGVAQHRDMPGLGIDLDIADMGREGGPGSLRIELTPRHRSGRRCAPP